DIRARPRFQRRGERVLRGFFGEVETAKQTDQRSQDARPLVAPYLLIAFAKDGFVERHEPIVAQPPYERRGDTRWAHDRQKKQLRGRHAHLLDRTDFDGTNLRSWNARGEF